VMIVSGPTTRARPCSGPSSHTAPAYLGPCRRTGKTEFRVRSGLFLVVKQGIGIRRRAWPSGRSWGRLHERRAVARGNRGALGVRPPAVGPRRVVGQVDHRAWPPGAIYGIEARPLLVVRLRRSAACWNPRDGVELRLARCRKGLAFARRWASTASLSWPQLLAHRQGVCRRVSRLRACCPRCQPLSSRF